MKKKKIGKDETIKSTSLPCSFLIKLAEKKKKKSRKKKIVSLQHREIKSKENKHKEQQPRGK
jgi:hypothetical protein